MCAKQPQRTRVSAALISYIVQSNLNMLNIPLLGCRAASACSCVRRTHLICRTEQPQCACVPPPPCMRAEQPQRAGVSAALISYIVQSNLNVLYTSQHERRAASVCLCVSCPHLTCCTEQPQRVCVTPLHACRAASACSCVRRTRLIGCTEQFQRARVPPPRACMHSSLSVLVRHPHLIVPVRAAAFTKS